MSLSDAIFQLIVKSSLVELQ